LGSWAAFYSCCQAVAAQELRNSRAGLTMFGQQGSKKKILNREVEERKLIRVFVK
jgi:hypothetical protein